MFLKLVFLSDFKEEVTIGNVHKKIKLPKKPQYIPHKYCKQNLYKIQIF